MTYSVIETEIFMRRYPNFTWDELKCPCGECVGVPIHKPEFIAFMDALQVARTNLAFPFHMTSVYRCPAYNDALYVKNGLGKPGEHRNGPHTKGAGDLLVSFERMYALIKFATRHDMGIGIKQHGPVDGRYIHLDNLGARLWSYS